MNFEWQVCSIEQAEELHGLGVLNPSDLFVWFWSVKASDISSENPGYKKTKSLGIKSQLNANKEGEPIYVTDEKLPGLVTYSTFNAFTLSEIALMLGYSWVSNNARDAADRLIMEIKNGTTSANEVNAKLKEAQNI